MVDHASGDPLADVEVEATGKRLAFDYRLDPASCRTDTEGFCTLPLEESKVLSVKDATVVVRSEGGILEVSAEEWISKARVGVQTWIAEGHSSSVPTTLLIRDEQGRPVDNAALWKVGNPGCYAKSNKEGLMRIVVPGAEGGWLLGAPGHETRLIESDSFLAGKEFLLHSTEDSVGGRVVDPESNPIEDVQVTLSTVPRTGYSGPDGLVLFHGFRSPPAESVILERDGFSRRVLEAQVRNIHLTREVQWKLYPTSEVYGAVAGPKGWRHSDMEITLAGDPEVRTHVAPDGRFALREIPRGPQILLLWHLGEVVHMAEFHAPDRGQKVGIGKLRVQETTTLWGSVVDQEDAPIRDANVLLNLQVRSDQPLQPPILPNGRPYDPSLAVTDSSGLFSIAGVLVGTQVAVTAWKQGFGVQPKLVQVEDRLPELTLRLYRLRSVKLKVVSSADLEPIADAQISLDPGVPASEGNAWQKELQQRVLITDREGFVSADIFPAGEGSYEIYAEGFVNQREPWIHPEDGDEEITIQLTPAAQISGVLLGHEGEPLSGASVQLKRSIFGIDPPHSQTNAAGEFEIRGLPEGAVVLIVRAAGYDLQEKEVRLLPGENPPIQWILDEPETFSISGRVITEEGSGVANLQVLANDQRSAQVYSAMTDRDGYLRFEELPASVYTFRTANSLVKVKRTSVDLSSDLVGIEWKGFSFSDSE